MLSGIIDGEEGVFVWKVWDMVIFINLKVVVLVNELGDCYNEGFMLLNLGLNYYCIEVYKEVVFVL